MTSISFSSSSASIAEKRMRIWAQGLENAQRLKTAQNSRPLGEQIHPYLAVSREEGAGAAEIARRVCQQLGWELMDRELLIYMAEKYRVSQVLLDAVDEKASNWVTETFGKWFDQQTVTQQEYVVHLGELALVAAQHGSTAFVGRGVQFLLPRDRGVAVQIVAPWEMRLAEIMQRHELSHSAAERYLSASDEGRHAFIDQYFHCDVRDPHGYDLVINRQRCGLDGAVELITSAIRRRFPSL